MPGRILGDGDAGMPKHQDSAAATKDGANQWPALAKRQVLA
jgi:hypothetical protein